MVLDLYLKQEQTLRFIPKRPPAIDGVLGFTTSELGPTRGASGEHDGDFVYRSNDASHAIAGGKLGPKWEGPYEVTEALGNGAYKLRSTDGAVLPRTWNVANLKRCYL
nr:reverse transcriptase domain-containing protein [Tanacetum cinerariifolium]